MILCNCMLLPDTLSLNSVSECTWTWYIHQASFWWQKISSRFLASLMVQFPVKMSLHVLSVELLIFYICSVSYLGRIIVFCMPKFSITTLFCSESYPRSATTYWAVSAWQIAMVTEKINTVMPSAVPYLDATDDLGFISS